MRPKTMLAFAVLALCAAPALAQKVKGTPAPALPKVQGLFFAPQAYAVEPNIEVVLLLTDEQKTKIADAYKETLGAPALQELATKVVKNKKVLDEAERKVFDQFKAETEKAQADLKKRVGEILTADQQLLIKKVDDTLKSSLESILSNEQKEALAKAKAPKKKGT